MRRKPSLTIDTESSGDSNVCSDCDAMSEGSPSAFELPPLEGGYNHLAPDPPEEAWLTLEKLQFLRPRRLGEKRDHVVKAPDGYGKLADLALETLTLKDLAFVRLLGAGAYGKVYLVKDRRTGARYALKHLSKAVAIQIPRNLIDEVRAMSAAHGCPFTARLLKTFVDDSAFHLLQDAILGGELFSRVVTAPNGRLDEDTARFYMACAVTTLGELHSRGLLHRDVKPENLLIAQDGYLTLVDFGSACKFGPNHEARTVTFCGTADYLAPEVLLQRLYEWGPAADCWALGVTLYFMVTGRLPFAVPDVNRTVGTGSPRLADPRFKFPPDLEFSAVGRDLVCRLLERNPRKRLGGGGLGAVEIKSHPWFAGVDWAALERRAVPAPQNPGLKVSLDAASPVFGRGADRTDRDMLPGCSPVDSSDPVTAAILARLDTFFGEEKWREEGGREQEELAKRRVAMMLEKDACRKEEETTHSVTTSHVRIL